MCVCVCIGYIYVNVAGKSQYKESRTKKKNLAPVRYNTTTLTLTVKAEVSDGGVALERRRQCLGSLGADAIVWRESEERGETSVLTDEFFRASPSSTPTIHRTHTHTHTHIEAYQASRGVRVR